MKQSLAKRLLSTSVAIIAAMQCMAATVSVSAADMVSVYKKRMPIRPAKENKAKTAGILCTRTVRAHT